MYKRAFVFPGQGVQHIGMGKIFFDNFKESREIYQIASEASGLNVEELCFCENNQLNDSKFTQVGLLATEVAILQGVLKSGIKADISAGLSLGEYGAIAYANVMNYFDLFKLVNKRAHFMQEICPKDGMMITVIGASLEDTEKIIQDTNEDVCIANDNCPGMFVLAGKEKAVLNVQQQIKKNDNVRFIPINLNIISHSILLKEAGDKLANELLSIEISKPNVPYVSNVTAEIVTTKDCIKQLLAKQIYSRVRFRESLIKLIDYGVEEFIEIGPSKTLSSFVKRIDKTKKIFHIETIEDLNVVLNSISV